MRACLCLSQGSSQEGAGIPREAAAGGPDAMSWRGGGILPCGVEGCQLRGVMAMRGVPLRRRCGSWQVGRSVGFLQPEGLPWA